MSGPNEYVPLNDQGANPALVLCSGTITIGDGPSDFFAARPIIRSFEYLPAANAPELTGVKLSWDDLPRDILAISFYRLLRRELPAAEHINVPWHVIDPSPAESAWRARGPSPATSAPCTPRSLEWPERGGNLARPPALRRTTSATRRRERIDRDDTPWWGRRARRAATMKAGVVSPPLRLPASYVQPRVVSSDDGRRVRGKVVLGVPVRPNGRVGKVNISDDVDRELERAAIAAVKQWRYRPALRDGVPTPARLKVGRGANFVFEDWWRMKTSYTTRGSPARSSPARFGYRP